jgi:hypothetical protein
VLQGAIAGLRPVLHTDGLQNPDADVRGFPDDSGEQCRLPDSRLTQEQQ